jgi:hypothetical protein
MATSNRATSNRARPRSGATRKGSAPKTSAAEIGAAASPGGTGRNVGVPEQDHPAAALAPETTTGPTPTGEVENNPDQTAASGVDPERNGAATQVGTTRETPDPSEGPATAAHPGEEERSGTAHHMRENHTARDEKPGEGQLLNGFRAELGTGTGTPAPDDERPTYPSTTLVRKSPRATPLEPADVKRAVEPRLGHDLTSTDAAAAAAGLRSMAGENATRLLDADGKEVSASDVFESVESNPTIRIVKTNVVEEYTVHRQKTPLTRLLFFKGQVLPAQQAEMFVAQHG